MTIYSTPTDSYSVAAKRWFAEHGVRYTEYDVSRDPVRASEMYRLTGQGSVPVIRVGGQFMVGFDPLQLARLLPDAHAGNGAGGGAQVSLGMAAQSLTAEAAEAAGLPAPFGVLVGAVREGGPAATAGIQPGDIIVGVGSYTLQNLVQLQNIVAQKKPGDTLVVRIWRDGVETECTIAFPEPEPADAAAPAASS